MIAELNSDGRETETLPLLNYPIRFGNYTSRLPIGNGYTKRGSLNYTGRTKTVNSFTNKARLTV